MGFSVSWLAFTGKSKDEVLSALHLVDTGVLDEAAHGPMSVASFPHDWTIVFLNRFDHPFAEDSSLRLFSQGCTVIACHVEENIMFSSSELYEEGKMVWGAFHDAQQGVYHIEADGALPPAFDVIKTRMIADQTEKGGASADVDCVFDIPLKLATSYYGFEHDRSHYDWGEPRFTELRDRTSLQ
ncbi:MAG TPA: hypothetical protein VGG10_11230 [Rhizomicrobium sp.]|jgi:hypothetical protein